MNYDELLIPRDIVKTNTFFKYKRMSKLSEKFLNVFNEYARKNKFKNIEYSDFIQLLRTHLFMKKISLNRINEYINNIVSPKLCEFINSKIENKNK